MPFAREGAPADQPLNSRARYQGQADRALRDQCLLIKTSLEVGRKSDSQVYVAGLKATSTGQHDILRFDDQSWRRPLQVVDQLRYACWQSGGPP